MDHRKRKSPKREYIKRLTDTYISPKRRNISRSSSPARHHRFSPYNRKPSSTSSKSRTKRSRSRSLLDSRFKFNSEIDFHGRYRSRSCEKIRKNNGEVRKPNYTGAENPAYLEKVRYSPSRIIVVRIEDKSKVYDGVEGNTNADRRSAMTDKKDYLERKYVHECHSSSAERTSHSRGSKKQSSSYEDEIRGRDEKRLRNSDNERSERDRKYYESHSRRRERSKDCNQRSDSSYRRDQQRKRKFRNSREDKANGEHSRYSKNKEENIEHQLVNGEQEDGTKNFICENGDRNDEEIDDSQDGTNNDVIYPMVQFPLPRVCTPVPRPPILLLPPFVPPRFRIWPTVMQRYAPPPLPFPRPMFVRGPYPPLPPTF